MQTRVRPALARGGVVITDRYLDSSVAYQGAARSLGSQEVRDLSLWATQGLLPDLTILLDAEPGIAARRAGERAALDRLEREPSSFHVALREEFLALAAAEPGRFVVIDADRGVEEVAEQVTAAVVRLIRSRTESPGGHVPQADASHSQVPHPTGGAWAALSAFAATYGGREVGR